MSKPQGGAWGNDCINRRPVAEEFYKQSWEQACHALHMVPNTCFFPQLVTDFKWCMTPSNQATKSTCAMTPCELVVIAVSSLPSR
jgi:hypothetical protein